MRLTRLDLLLLTTLSASPLTEAVFEREGHGCVRGEYWCHDRCGSDAYGQTCCETPDGGHNLCGSGTTCCLYGCCPEDTTCNLYGGCDKVITSVDPDGNLATSTVVIEPTYNPPVVPTSSDTAARSSAVQPDPTTLSRSETASRGTGEPETALPRSISSASVTSSNDQTSETGDETTVPGATLSGTSVPHESSTDTHTQFPEHASETTDASVGTDVDPTNVLSATSQGGGSASGATTAVPNATDSKGGDKNTTSGNSDRSLGPTTSGAESTTAKTREATDPGVTDNLTTTTIVPGTSVGQGGTGTSATTSNFSQESGIWSVSSPAVSAPGVTLSHKSTVAEADTPSTSATEANSSRTTLSGVRDSTAANPIVSSSSQLPTDNTSNSQDRPKSTKTGEGSSTPSRTETNNPVATDPGTFLSSTQGDSTTSDVVLPPSATGASTTNLITSDTTFAASSSSPVQPSEVTGSDGASATSNPVNTESHPTEALATSSLPDTTVEDLVTYTTWPSLTVVPVTTKSDGPEPTESGYVDCNAWFFQARNDINIFGWIFGLPPGIYIGPPPPPAQIFPPGINIDGTLPPWPPITIGNDGKATYSDEPTSCETQTASFCTTITSYDVSVSQTSTITTASHVYSTCHGILGCDIDDAEATETTTASCSVITVTDAWVSCTASSACKTTSTSVLTGCDVTATTKKCINPSATATGAQRRAEDDDIEECEIELRATYVVYPEDGTNTVMTGAITSSLQEYQSESLLNVEYTSHTETMGINFWLILCTRAIAAEFRNKNSANVASVYLQEGALGKRDPTISLRYKEAPNYQACHTWQLPFISQMEERTIESYKNRYYFDNVITKKPPVPVYVVDTGAWVEFPDEFDQYRKNGKSTIRFIHVGKDVDQLNGQNRNDDSGTSQDGSTKAKTHGTSMLSLVAGKTVGVMPYGVEPVVVRVPRLEPTGGGATQEHWIEAISKVCDDIKDASAKARAVMVFSSYFTVDDFKRPPTDDGDLEPSETMVDYSRGFRIRLRALLAEAIRKGVVPVTGSGNNKLKAKITGVPAAFGRRDVSGNIDLPELIVVGALATGFRDGSWWSPPYPESNIDEEGGLPHVWAPGVAVCVPDVPRAVFSGLGGQDPFAEYTGSKGTSDAAALTGGLIAYFIKMRWEGQLKLSDKTPMGIKTHMMSLAWSRPTGETFGPSFPGIWNGALLKEKKSYCEFSEPKSRKRSEDALPWADEHSVYERTKESASANNDSCRIPWETEEITTAAEPTTLATSILSKTSRDSSTVATSTDESSITQAPSETLPTATSSIAKPTSMTLACANDSDCSRFECPGDQTSTCVKVAILPGTGFCLCSGTTMTDATSVRTTSKKKTTTSTTTTSAEPTVSKTPLKLTSAVCNNEDDFRGHADVRSRSVMEMAIEFYDDYGYVEMTEVHGEVAETLADRYGINMSYSVSWIKGCVTTSDKQKISEPLDDEKTFSFDIFYAAWEQCNNGGVGGYIDAGCLRYLFKGGI